MYRLLETIRLHNGQFHNLSFHEARMKRSRYELMGITGDISLSGSLLKMNIPSTGLWRCRIIYSGEVETIGFYPYTKREINSLKLINDDLLDYAYKFENRTALSDLAKSKDGCDEILILRKGEITDTSFSNVALWDGMGWKTPQHPLLRGTKREQLVNDGLLKEAIIQEKDLKNYEKICLINAMLDLGELELPVSEIH